ncbi:hypothetical protein E3N88_31134 [Mikania micrantha]|uniref:Uncharacterized protein n=1 Tax=Mikania micrantha TaxID=192012 RepID=A0A5N6MNS7_9ASTR|nr:hypothetical protein E3N88_31134 [Mikania micrantha]
MEKKAIPVGYHYGVVKKYRRKSEEELRKKMNVAVVVEEKGQTSTSKVDKSSSNGADLKESASKVGTYAIPGYSSTTTPSRPIFATLILSKVPLNNRILG